MQENCERQRHICFDNSKLDLFLKYLKGDLAFSMYNDKINQIYHNFTKTIFTTIKKFSTKVYYTNNNRTSNPWYDRDCKITMK